MLVVDLYQVLMMTDLWLVVDFRQIVSCGGDGVLKLFDVNTMTEIFSKNVNNELRLEGRDSPRFQLETYRLIPSLLLVLFLLELLILGKNQQLFYSLSSPFFLGFKLQVILMTRNHNLQISAAHRGVLFIK